MSKPKKDFVKISIQDIEIAETFFENEKHLSEFLINVIRYYRGKEIKIKTKIVKKYFETYKKTMDFVIQAKLNGKLGADIKAENQAIKGNTLEGVVKDTLKETLSTKKKEEREKNEGLIIPSKELFLSYASEKYSNCDLDKVGLKYESWMANNWKDGNDKQIKNWKTKLLNTLPYLKKELDDSEVVGINGRTLNQAPRPL